MTQNKSIAFIGAGNMNRAILGGLVNNGYPAKNIFVSNPSIEKLNAMHSDFSVNISQSNQEIVEKSDVVVLGVKPQKMEAMCADLQSIDLQHKLFISIAAGLPVKRLQQMLDGEYPIIRVMPNTPSLLGLGMSGLYAGDSTSEQDKQFAEHIMSAVGKVLWVKEESDIDAIIATAGSGPAYFFLFMEAMQAEAIAMGFSDSEARELVQQTALGAANMVAHNEDLSIEDLRKQVTSKGGTTAAALATFEQSGLKDIVSKSMRAAVTRAQELANSL